jgi:hypothetical protein
MQKHRASVVIGCKVILHASLFAKHGSRSEGRFAPTLTHRGDAFGREHVGKHRFSSSGLNLAFEGLLLGASLHLRVKATSSNPRKSDPELAMPMHNAREAPLCFAGNCWHRRYVARGQRYRRSSDEGLRRCARRKLSRVRRLRMRVEGGAPTIIQRSQCHHRHVSVSYWKHCKVVS